MDVLKYTEAAYSLLGGANLTHVPLCRSFCAPTDERSAEAIES
jgi:hypothetical protein